MSDQKLVRAVKKRFDVSGKSHRASDQASPFLANQSCAREETVWALSASGLDCSHQLEAPPDFFVFLSISLCGALF